MVEEILFTVDEVAEILKVKRRYVYDMLKCGRLRGIKLAVGKRSVWRIPTSEINSLCSEAFDKIKD